MKEVTCVILIMLGFQLSPAKYLLVQLEKTDESQVENRYSLTNENKKSMVKSESLYTNKLTHTCIYAL